MDSIAEREGIEPRQRKRWSKILDAFGAFAFAISSCIPPSSSSLMVSVAMWHLASLLTLHCALWHVVKGILQVPQDQLWLLREMAEATLYFSRAKLASTPREVARMYPQPKCVDPTHAFLMMAHLTWRATNVRFFIVLFMHRSCVNRRFVLGYSNCGRPTLLLLLFSLLLLLLLLLKPILVCIPLLLLLLLTPAVVCEFVTSGMQCLLNIPKMPMVN